MGILDGLKNEAQKVETKIEETVNPQAPVAPVTPTQPEAEPVVEEAVTQPVDRSAFNCPECSGSGIVKDQLCPRCQGRGKV